MTAGNIGRHGPHGLGRHQERGGAHVQGGAGPLLRGGTEVYFTDYGFGKLKDGKAVIAIDPLFAETVNANEPYHVFVQAYGKADLYVSNRTSNSFEVAVNSGDGNVEFSYRLVAKRRGFETARLELAPPAGKDADLAAQKGEEKVALVKE